MFADFVELKPQYFGIIVSDVLLCKMGLVRIYLNPKYDVIHINMYIMYYAD